VALDTHSTILKKSACQKIRETKSPDGAFKTAGVKKVLCLYDARRDFLEAFFPVARTGVGPVNLTKVVGPVGAMASVIGDLRDHNPERACFTERFLGFEQKWALH